VPRRLVHSLQTFTLCMGMIISDGFTHRPWPRAPRFLVPRATPSYNASLLKTWETEQRHTFTIHFETSENANVKTLVSRAGGRVPRTPRPGGPRAKRGPPNLTEYFCYGI